MFDLQINGLLEANCNFWQAPEPESINNLCKYQKSRGINKFLATIITASIDDIERNLEAIANYINHYGNEELVGVHLEGGLITRFGVHPPEYAKSLNYKEAQKILAKFPNLIKLWTLCPKLDENGDITKLAQDSNIVVSYGHSNATYHEASMAFEKYQVNAVTHWGNAMYVFKNFKQRNCSGEDLELLDSIQIEEWNEKDLGIGLAAYRNPKIYCMAIAGSKSNQDEHLDPTLLRQLAIKKQDKFILVSDSVYESKPITKLVGGLTSLDIHYKNAIEASIPIELIKNAVDKNPYQLLNFN